MLLERRKMNLEEGSDGYRMVFEDRNISMYRTFRHELGNPLAVISGYLEAAEMEDDPEEQLMRQLKEERPKVNKFLSETDKVLTSLDKENWIPPKTAQTIEEYTDQFDGELGQKIDDVIEMVSWLKDYQKACSTQALEDTIALNEITSIFEQDYCAEIDYSISEDTEVKANEAVKIISQTTGENWVNYGSETGNALEDKEAELKIEIYQDQNEVALQVGDNGPGLNGKTPEEIFEKNCGEGTGFGLYLSREIAESFEGSIEYCQDAAIEKGFGYELRLKKA